MTKLKERIEQAAKKFETSTNNLHSFSFTLEGNPPVTYTKNLAQLRTATRTILGGSIKEETISNISDEILDLSSIMLEHLVLCSTPNGFKQAFDFKSNSLSFSQVELIKSKGGFLFPQHDKLKLCILYNSAGVIQSKNNTFVFGLKPTDSEFDDEINQMGQIKYFPPKDLTGALRFKWMQELCSALEIPMVVLVVKWFKCNLHETQERLENHLFCISAAKIIDYKEDIQDYKKSISKPLSLELISAQEAQEYLLSIKNLSSPFFTTSPLRTRLTLDSKLANQWNYNAIKADSSKALRLKKWAKEHNLCCPGCGKDFNSFSYSELHICHYLSQNYCECFPELSNYQHHPDNLYLGCYSCNSSLRDEIPTGITRKNIEANGRIGDWIRADLDGIKKIAIKNSKK